MNNKCIIILRATHLNYILSFVHGYKFRGLHLEIQNIAVPLWSNNSHTSILNCSFLVLCQWEPKNPQGNCPCSENVYNARTLAALKNLLSKLKEQPSNYTPCLICKLNFMSIEPLNSDTCALEALPSNLAVYPDGLKCVHYKCIMLGTFLSFTKVVKDINFFFKKKKN